MLPKKPAKRATWDEHTSRENGATGVGSAILLELKRNNQFGEGEVQNNKDL